MTGAVAAYGAKLSWNSVEIAEVKSISGPSQKVDMIDVSSHDSASAFKEFVAGLIDGGEVTIEGEVDTTDSTGLIALNTDMQARTSRTCQVTLPGSLGNWSGTAYCSGLEWSYPHDGSMTFTASFKYTGKPTLTIS